MPIPVLHTHARAIFPTSANSINQGWRGLLGLGWKITSSGHFEATKLSELINKVSSSLTTSISRELKLNQIGEIFLIQYSQVNHILTIFPILALQYSRQHCEVESQWIRPWNRSCPSLTWITNLIGLYWCWFMSFRINLVFSLFMVMCQSRQLSVCWNRTAAEWDRDEHSLRANTTQNLTLGLLL